MNLNAGNSLYCHQFIAEVVEWLTPSTAVREVAGSIPAKGMFWEKYLRLELSKKVRKANQKTVRRSDYKEVFRVS